MPAVYAGDTEERNWTEDEKPDSWREGGDLFGQAGRIASGSTRGSFPPVSRRGELVLPASDDDACEAVAKDVDGRATHVHELINPKEKKKRLRRQMKGSGCSQDDHQRCTGYAGRAFAADEKSKQHNRLLADGEMNVRSLHNEQ